MKTTSKALAWVCVALLILYPISATLVLAYLASGDDGILAALFAANAGTAFFVGLAFGLPEFSGHTSRTLRLSVVLIGVVCGLMSALHWMADEIDHLWLRIGIISPIMVILLSLLWFANRVSKEVTRHEGE